MLNSHQSRVRLSEFEVQKKYLGLKYPLVGYRAYFKKRPPEEKVSHA